MRSLLLGADNLQNMGQRLTADAELGSALLALAIERRAVTADAAWAAAHVDEDYQISLWGEDAEAVARRRGRRAEFDAACRWLALLEA